jgi:hypothetical protein
MTLECTELLVPVRLDLVEPRLQGQHRFSPEAKDAQTRIARDALVGDEASLKQDPQVPAHDGGGRPGSHCELAGPTLAVTEKLDHAPPRRIGERQEDAFHIVPHFGNT